MGLQSIRCIYRSLLVKSRFGSRFIYIKEIYTLRGIELMQEEGGQPAAPLKSDERDSRIFFRPNFFKTPLESD